MSWRYLFSKNSDLMSSLEFNSERKPDKFLANTNSKADFTLIR